MGGSDDMMKLMELQKTQLANETERMRQFMKDFMDQMTSMQNNNVSNSAYGGGFDKNRGQVSDLNGQT